MANVNDGTPMRFMNGGQMGIGTAGSATVILNWQDPGLIRLVPGHTEGIPFKSGASLASPAGVLDGDDRPTMIDIDVRYASSTAVNELRALLVPAATSGVKTFFTFILRIPRYKGATGSNTAEQWAFNRCWLPEPPVIAGGKEFDTLKATIQHYGPKVDPTWVDNSSAL